MSSSTETTTLYRAVSNAELRQIQKTGKFEVGKGTMEGKWFAEKAADARKWGDKMNGPGNSTVMRADIAKPIADKMYRTNSLDGIGPARFGTIDQLQGSRIRVYSP
jgi:hypothetical protein